MAPLPPKAAEPVAAARVPREIYQTPVLLPLIVGLASMTAGAVLVQADHSHAGTLVALLDTAVGLIVGGSLLYFLIGFWLIPGALVLGGGSFLVAFEVDAHLPAWAFGAGFVWIGLGAVGVVAAAWAWARPEPTARRTTD